jgi:hypothetical protein
LTAIARVRAAAGRGRGVSVPAGDALVTAVLAVPVFVLVLLAHGFLPGMVNAGGISYWTQGAINCVHDMGAEALTSNCHEFGEPLGFPLLTGGPVIVLGALLMYLPDVEPYGAYILSGAAFDALALAGGYGLMRRLGVGRVVAVLTAAAYLLTPTVVGMQGFGGTFTGFALLPAYAFIDLIVIDAVQRRSGRTAALVLAGYAVVKTLSLFLDGYSFVAGNLVSLLLWLTWLAGRDPVRQRKLVGVAGFVTANLVAAGLYSLYQPGPYPIDQLQVFRSMGLDLATLVVPSYLFWAPDWLGVSTLHQDLWGDTTNAIYNYAGVVCVLLAAYYLARRPRSRNAVAIAIAGLVALVLALGPALKVDDKRPGGPEYYYTMPEGAAVDLPWGSLYVDIPGVKSMRATYRWWAVTRMALIVLAGLAVARLWRTRRFRGLTIAVAGLALIELMPNLPHFTDGYERLNRDRNEFRADVIGELRGATREGERAFFLNYDGVHNDFLVNYVAPQVGVRAYNTGGDKNSLFAAQRWPPEIQALAQPGVTGDAVAQALDDGRTDVVIAPFFHLSSSAGSWPPPPAVRAQAEAAFAPILADPRFGVDRFGWFATIRKG